jgi:hypothetical protein
MNSIVIDARMIHHSGIGTYLKNLVPFLIERFDTELIAVGEYLNTLLLI